MAIYRGTGGASDSTDDSTISAVTTQAGIATTKASEAASSATDANTSATNAAASATAASGHASTSSDNATASSGSATDAAGFATAASNSATAASTSATAAANSASIANSAEVQAVAAKTTEITGVYNDIANVNTVAGNIADVNTVATNSSNITAVAGDASDIGTVATSISNVNTVGDNIASVNAVASNNTNINTVAADASDIGTVAGISGNVTTVAGISSDVTTVAGLESKMDTVIADASDIGTVAGNIGDVSTVAGISSDVDTVAGISADVTSVADNMADVQNATTSATNAATSAVSASDSASAASTSAGSASSSASSASTSATNASNSATAASNSATAASSSASAASGSASAASGSASAAASSASAASTSASNAATSETNAASSASAAATNATNAATSETNAAASAADSSNAASTWSNYYNTYVGASSSEPTVDVQGNALVAGALYFNTTNNTTYVWTGSAWNAVANNNIINPNVALTQDLATNGNDVKFGDNDKATFGTGDDLQIYHDGSNSVISDGGTGSLLLRGSNVWIQNADGTETGARFITDGAIDLRHNNSIKLATTSTGIDVTGDVSIGDGSASATRLLMGSGDDSKMFHNGIDTYWINDTGNIIIRNQSDDKDILFQTDDGSGGTTTYITVDGSETDVSLHYGGAQKLATTSTGIDVTGTATMDGLTVDSSASAQIDLNDRNGTVSTIKQDYTALTLDADLNNTYPSSYARIRVDGVEGFRLSAGGDISFYEDTGTTPKFFWDASAESLGIGTSSPNHAIDVTTSATTWAGAIKNTNVTNGYGLFLQSAESASKAILGAYSGSSYKFYVRGDGNVGIGTSSPVSILHLTSTNDPTITLEDTGFGASATLKGSNGNMRIGSTTATLFDMGGSEVARFDSSGNLLVGTSNPLPGYSNTVEGVSVREGSHILASRSEGASGYFNRNTNDGNIVEFRKDGTPVGSIGTGGGDVVVASRNSKGFKIYAPNADGTGTILHPSTDAAGNPLDAKMNLGYSSGRFKDLHLSGTAYVGTSVGIGTDSPSAKLHLKDTTGSAVNLLQLETGWNNPSGNKSIVWTDSTNTLGRISVDYSAPKTKMRFGSLYNSGYQTGDVMTLTSDGRVGIGTSSPARELSIGDGTGSPNIQLLAAASGNSRIEFGDTDDSDAGEIQYVHSSNYMQFTTNSAERMRIDALGNASFNTTNISPASNNVFGTAILQYGGASMSRTNSTTLDLNRSSSDGAIINLRKDGTTVGSIGVALSDNLYFSGVDAGIGCGTSAIYPATTTGQSSDNDTDLGTASTRFRNAYLGGGVYLGGTGAANKLEDYEEGTWTPVLKDGAGNTTTWAGTAQGYYTKVGNTVNAWFVFSSSSTAITTRDYVTVSGLPFTAITSEGASVSTLSRVYGFTINDANYYVQANSNNINFKQLDSGNSDMELTPTGSVQRLSGGSTYRTS